MSHDAAKKTNLQVALPDQFPQYSPELQAEVVAYLSQLDAMERKAYTIGKAHLGTSFNVPKSNGFGTWRARLLAESLQAAHQWSLKDMRRVAPASPPPSSAASADATNKEVYEHKPTGRQLAVVFCEEAGAFLWTEEESSA